MRARLLFMVLWAGVMFPAPGRGQAVDEQASLRGELEKKYPDIKFNWPKSAPSADGSAVPATTGGGASVSGTKAPAVPATTGGGASVGGTEASAVPATTGGGASVSGTEASAVPATTGGGASVGGTEAPAVSAGPTPAHPDLGASEAGSADASRIAEEEVTMRQKRRRNYTLGPGDVISLNVRDHPEFSSFGVRVGFAGEVILPLTNEVVYAEGLGVEEVRMAIEEKIKAYIEQPFVSVFITEFNSKKFYVLGEIGAGIYPIGATSIKLMDALYAAGLPSEGIAAMRRVQIITPHETDPINRWVNVYAILYKGRMEHNITIEPGTIIYVPTTVFTKFSRVIRQISVTIEDLSKIPNDLASFNSGLIAWDASWNLNIFPKGVDLHGGNMASRWYPN